MTYVRLVVIFVCSSHDFKRDILPKKKIRLKKKQTSNKRKSYKKIDGVGSINFYVTQNVIYQATV